MADHLSIGEVLGLLQEDFPDVTISKIRFLESQGLLDPERTPSGYRKFYEADIERLRWILKQQRENFLPLKVIKMRLLGQAAGAPEPADDEEALATVVAGQDPAAAVATPGALDAPTPVPIWMSDIARQAERSNSEDDDSSSEAAHVPAEGSSGSAESSESSERPADPSPRAPARTWKTASAAPLDAGPATISLTAVELARAARIDITVVRELERFGLLQGRQMGSDRFYDGEALMVAEMSAAFFERGLEPRHLRMFKMAAEREAGLLEQVVMPLLRQRNPQARQQAIDLLGELALLGEQLRSTLLRGLMHELLQSR